MMLSLHVVGAPKVLQPTLFDHSACCFEVSAR